MTRRSSAALRVAEERIERLVYAWVTEAEAKTLGSGGHGALSGQQQRVRHFPQHDAQRESRRGHERGTMHRAAERPGEIPVGDRIRRRRVERAARLGPLER